MPLFESLERRERHSSIWATSDQSRLFLPYKDKIAAQRRSFGYECTSCTSSPMAAYELRTSFTSSAFSPNGFISCPTSPVVSGRLFTPSLGSRTAGQLLLDLDEEPGLIMSATGCHVTVHAPPSIGSPRNRPCSMQSPRRPLLSCPPSPQPISCPASPQPMSRSPSSPPSPQPILFPASPQPTSPSSPLFGRGSSRSRSSLATASSLPAPLPAEAGTSPPAVPQIGFRPRALPHVATKLPSLANRISPQQF